MSIELVDQVTDEIVEAVNYLIPQLSSSAGSLSYEEVEQLIDQPDVYLFIYRQDPEITNSPEADPTALGPIKGMLSLATFIIPTGTRAWIEDVVVDEATRGSGAGQKLVEAACEYAKHLGAKTVDLTSRPTREAANRLYRRCGFEARETNVYRYAN
ncbi:GNAT family N-acetyltransferase [Actinomycetaceae bacterium TAE3-ERU4]|nr:GNAT family N-acetyltransferase [Actinomycetaceae bacterium TAE3-ERU4]